MAVTSGAPVGIFPNPNTYSTS